MGYTFDPVHSIYYVCFNYPFRSLRHYGRKPKYSHESSWKQYHKLLAFISLFIFYIQAERTKVHLNIGIIFTLPEISFIIQNYQMVN